MLVVKWTNHFHHLYFMLPLREPVPAMLALAQLLALKLARLELVIPLVLPQETARG